MSSSYHHPSVAEKPEFVRRKFAEIAHRYDLVNDVMTQGQHRLWKNRVAKLCVQNGDEHGIDLCCGTGDIALRQLKLMRGGEVFGMDFCYEMLTIAQRRLASAKNCVLLQSDALNLPFADNSMDFVSISYGLRNVGDHHACLKQIYSVLKPNGRLVCLDLGKIRYPLLRPLANFYMFRIVPLIGKLLQRGNSMYDYLPASTTDYPHQDQLRQDMLQAGFKRVDLYEYSFGLNSIHVAHKS